MSPVMGGGGGVWWSKLHVSRDGTFFQPKSTYFSYFCMKTCVPTTCVFCGEIRKKIVT